MKLLSVTQSTNPLRMFLFIGKYLIRNCNTFAMKPFATFRAFCHEISIVVNIVGKENITTDTKHTMFLDAWFRSSNSIYSFWEYRKLLKLKASKKMFSHCCWMERTTARTIAKENLDYKSDRENTTVDTIFLLLNLDLFYLQDGIVGTPHCCD